MRGFGDPRKKQDAQDHRDYGGDHISKPDERVAVLRKLCLSGYRVIS